MENQIQPDDTLRILLTANKLQDRAEVTKIRGTKPYVFRRNLTIYVDQKSGATPQTIEGYFLVDQQGGISQIAPTDEVMVSIRAETLVDQLTHEWDFEDK